jgi:hypothetical protein
MQLEHGERGAQRNYGINFYVNDEATGEAVSDVEIILNDGLNDPMYKKTNFRGRATWQHQYVPRLVKRYTDEGLYPEQFEVRFEKDGYKTLSIYMPAKKFRAEMGQLIPTSYKVELEPGKGDAKKVEAGAKDPTERRREQQTNWDAMRRGW